MCGETDCFFGPDCTLVLLFVEGIGYFGTERYRLKLTQQKKVNYSYRCPAVVPEPKKSTFCGTWLGHPQPSRHSVESFSAMQHLVFQRVAAVPQVMVDSPTVQGFLKNPTTDTSVTGCLVKRAGRRRRRGQCWPHSGRKPHSAPPRSRNNTRGS